MKNRIITMMAGVIIVSLVGSTASFAAFVDVPRSHWAYDAVDYLMEEGLVEGYPDGLYRGDETLSRYEFAMVIARLYDGFIDIIESQDSPDPGPDVEAIMETLMDEFSDELVELRTLSESNEERISELEDSVSDNDESIDDINDSIDSMDSRFHPFGDLRLRFEGKYPESGLQTQRPRFRLRFGFTSEVTDELTFGARFASGKDGAITSTNNTIDDSFGMDGVFIDRAYLQYSPVCYPGFTMWGGKFSPPWHTTPMSWDSDVMVEGIAQHYNHENFNFYLAELVPTVEGYYLVAQAGIDDLFVEGFNAAATYHFINEKAWEHIMDDMIAGDLKSRFVFENLDSPTDYRGFEGYTSYSNSYGTTPWMIETNYLRNLENVVEGLPDWTQAAWARFTLNGKPRNEGDWRFRGEWGRVQANSVLSWITDADRGSGDHEWMGAGLTYRLLRNTDLGITFLTVDRLSRDNSGYDLFQVDVKTKF